MVNINFVISPRGIRIGSLSPHSFLLSDGTIVPAQKKEICDSMTLSRVMEFKKHICGMKVNSIRMELTFQQQDLLRQICGEVDLLIVPFPVLTALREQGIRDNFQNAVAFNATAETQRSAPDQKVVDIDNWSW